MDSLYSSKYLLRTITETQYRQLARGIPLVPKQLDNNKSLGSHVSSGSRSAEGSNKLSFSHSAYSVLDWLFNITNERYKYLRSSLYTILVKKSDINSGAIKEDMSTIKGVTAKNFASSSKEQVYSGIIDRPSIRLVSPVTLFILASFEVDTDRSYNRLNSTRFLDLREVILDLAYEYLDIDLFEHMTRKKGTALCNNTLKLLNYYCDYSIEHNNMLFGEFFDIAKDLKDWVLDKSKNTNPNDIQDQQNLAKRMTEYQNLLSINHPQTKTDLYFVEYNQKKYLEYVLYDNKEELIIPEDVFLIQAYSLLGCKHLKSLYISGDSIFGFPMTYGCDNLEYMNVHLWRLNDYFSPALIEHLPSLKKVLIRGLNHTYSKEELLSKIKDRSLYKEQYNKFGIMH